METKFKCREVYKGRPRFGLDLGWWVHDGSNQYEDRCRQRKKKTPGSRVDLGLGLVERVHSGEGGSLAQTWKDEMIGLDQTRRK